MPFLNVLEGNSKLEITAYLSDFKERGVVNFTRSLAVPVTERIPMLSATKEGYNRILIALSASIKSAMSNINLRVGLSEDQIVELADQIISESHEDNLALEDVLLFLQQLIAGKAGKIYDRMDIPTFFELFDNYREDRHKTLKNIRYEQEINHKSEGPTEKFSNDRSEREAHKNALKEHLQRIYKLNP